MRLSYTPEAIADIQEIKYYIEKVLRNPTAADRISKVILDACSSLKAFPKLGASVEGRTGFETDLRMLTCENWIAIYRIEDGSDTVFISRIIDGRQDYMRILFSEMNFTPAMDEIEAEEETEEHQAGPLMTM